jgi:hypothetical protein
VKEKAKIVIDDTPVVEQAPAVVLTREQVENEIAHLQWLISRDEKHVEERHQRLEVLYGLRDKMDELENE